MNDIRQDRNKLYLYARYADGSFVGTDPPIRVELLKHRDVKAAATLAWIAFSLPALPHFCWDGDSAWLDCHSNSFPGFCDPMFSDVADFISALPELQSWLAAWAASERRAPDPTPGWAIQRQLDGKLTQAIELKRFLNAPTNGVTRCCNATFPGLCCNAQTGTPCRITAGNPP